MALVIREFETMVDETLQRIVNANIGITNIYPGSVIRTIIESLLAEVDIQNYSIDQIYKAMNIDTATGEDLDAIVAILGVTRRRATYATGTVVFGRSDAYDTDIAIQYAQIISTKQDADGSIHEFIVTDEDAKLTSGNLQTTVNIRAMDPGIIYLPINSITVMNTPIIGIEYVTNTVAFNGGTNDETDDELRARAKLALAGLGKGTATALRSALLNISGVIDAVVMDANRGVGTTDIIVITNTLPPPESLQNIIADTISATKAAGINVDIIYPTIKTQDVNVTLTNIAGGLVSQDDINNAASAIIGYCNTLLIGDVLIISQLERHIGNAIDNSNIDVVVTVPSSNVTPTSTQVIRCGNITINGVVFDG